MDEKVYNSDPVTNKISFKMDNPKIVNMNDGVMFCDVVTHDKHYHKIAVALDVDGGWKDLARILLGGDEKDAESMEATLRWYEHKGERSNYILKVWRGRKAATRYNFVEALLQIGKEDLAEYILNLPSK